MSDISVALNCAICHLEARDNSPLFFWSASALAHVKCIENGDATAAKIVVSTAGDMRFPTVDSEVFEELPTRRRSTSLSRNASALKAAEQYGKAPATEEEAKPIKPPLLRRKGGSLSNLPTLSTEEENSLVSTTQPKPIPRAKSAANSRLPSVTSITSIAEDPNE